MNLQQLTGKRWKQWFLVLALAAVALVALPAIASAQIATQLERGSEGMEVQKLQAFLAQFPDIYPSGLVTGYFGSLTEAAVQGYQCQEGIVCSGTPATTGYGRVGPETVAAINATFEGGVGGPALISGNLDLGDRSEEVRNLQRFLADDSDLYPSGLVTGYFGTLTRDAVRRFQCQENIVCNGTPETTGYGRIGPQTADSMNQMIEEGTTGTTTTGTSTETSTSSGTTTDTGTMGATTSDPMMAQ